MRKQTPSTYEVIFSVVKLIGKTNKNDVFTLKLVTNYFNDFNNDNVQHKRPSQRVSESNVIGETNTGREQRQYTTGNDRQVSKRPQFLSG